MTEPRPFLDQVNLVVSDMDSALAFYRRLGVDIPDSMPEWDPHHRSARVPGGIDFDLDSVEFAKQWDEGTTGPTCTVGFKFGTRAEVDRVYADLTGAGYRGRQAPYDAFWGARYAIVEDPDGNPVGLMSPIDAAMRSDVTPPS
jgi:uncharacterized glyoxalase superfamily protein PhnB